MSDTEPFNKDLLDAIATELGSLVYEDDRLRDSILSLKAEVEELKARSINLEIRTDKSEADIAELKAKMVTLKSSFDAAVEQAAELHKDAAQTRLISAQLRAKSVVSRLRATETRTKLQNTHKDI